mmetsp:Transcript_8372/g.16673  ORF Transcript_8372/g.16673 Transcript_8372/m.16673 type:complete len:202 (+) Transcript_8372:937-1542(+)
MRKPFSESNFARVNTIAGINTRSCETRPYRSIMWNILPLLTRRSKAPPRNLRASVGRSPVRRCVSFQRFSSSTKSRSLKKISSVDEVSCCSKCLSNKPPRRVSVLSAISETASFPSVAKWSFQDFAKALCAGLEYIVSIRSFARAQCKISSFGSFTGRMVVIMSSRFISAEEPSEYSESISLSLPKTCTRWPSLNVISICL